MSQPTIFSSKSNPSASYISFLYGMHQESGDGGTQILDISAALNNATVDAGTSYGAIMAEASWLTAVSGQTSVSTGKGWRLATVPSRAWDMAAGKSLLLAFKVKTPTANTPSTGGPLLGNTGGGSAGFDISVNSAAGRPNFNLRDGTHNFSTGSFGPTNSGLGICDGNEHLIVIMVDGTAKKLYAWVDNINYFNGSDVSTINLSTAGTFNLSFGHNGNPGGTGTWDSAASPTSASVKFRAIQYLVMSAFPTNYNQIAAYLAEGVNIFRQIPKTLLQ